MKHWHVMVGQEGGYLPDSQWLCETQREARDSARETAERIAEDLDDDDEGATAEGGPDLWTIEVPGASATHLRTYVEVSACEEDCKAEDFE